MDMILVSVFDRAVQSFDRPFAVRSMGEAMRVFRDEINREGSELAKHPTDYELHKVGVFHADNGEMGVSGVPDLIVRGEDCVEVKHVS